VSVQNSEFVDLLYFDGTSFVTVLDDIDDSGCYEWWVPDDEVPASMFRVVFRDEAGTVLTTVDSPVFSVPEPAEGLGQLAAITTLSLGSMIAARRRSQRGSGH
jgi:hypothetical protein